LWFHSSIIKLISSDVLKKINQNLVIVANFIILYSVLMNILNERLVLFAQYQLVSQYVFLFIHVYFQILSYIWNLLISIISFFKIIKISTIVGIKQWILPLWFIIWNQSTLWIHYNIWYAFRLFIFLLSPLTQGFIVQLIYHSLCHRVELLDFSRLFYRSSARGL